MAVVTIRSAVVAGGGAVTCRHCDRRTTFSGNEWLEFVDDGHTLSCTAVSEGISVLHDCRRKRTMKWVCPQCHTEGEPRLLGRGRRKPRFVKTCQHCFMAELVQVQVSDPPGD